MQSFTFNLLDKKKQHTNKKTNCLGDDMKILSNDMVSQDRLISFFEEYCGDNLMVVSSGTYVLSKLPGFVAIKSDKIVAAMTYCLKGSILEIISLDSIEENKGIGSKLIQQIEMVANELGSKAIQVITTNDNLRAIAFYQKRGFRFNQIFTDAVKVARHIKPSIPLYADNGLPIRDEILFIKKVKFNDDSE